MTRLRTVLVPTIAVLMAGLACSEPPARAGGLDGLEGEARAAASPDGADSMRTARAAAMAAVRCDPDNGGLVLPDGFCAAIVADQIGRPRHIAIAANGDLYVTLRGTRREPGSALALRDTTGDGAADIVVPFDSVGGTGVELWRDWVYIGRDDAVVRYRRAPDTLEPRGPAEVMISGLRADGGHAAKPIQITPDGELFINIGSPSNSCQVEDRLAGSPGKDPCDERAANAGIWRFSATTPGQTLADGERFAAGMRNTVALAYNPTDAGLYAVVHGRDQLLQNWPGIYDAEASATLPAEEFVRVREGDDYGWPYCYFDQLRGVKTLAPEYGGDGETAGRCADMDRPLVGFPGHWAPNGLTFYDATAFPGTFHGAAFIAFHGSWNRAPLSQEGANVVFVPRTRDGYGHGWGIFARGQDDWAESREHRPSGVGVGPDGSLYITDDAGGRIWRVVYRP